MELTIGLISIGVAIITQIIIFTAFLTKLNSKALTNANNIERLMNTTDKMERHLASINGDVKEQKVIVKDACKELDKQDGRITELERRAWRKE